MLSFAVVFPYSSHNYLLRYWMADAGIDPDKDVRLIVVPPPQVGHYLRAGMIAGCCVGEPWNTLAVSEGLGRIVVTSRDIWNNHPEKVFAVTRNWAHSNPNTHKAALMALLEACNWLDEPANRPETCELLSQGRYVNVPVDILEKSLTGTLLFASESSPRSAPDYNVFQRYAANFPWRSHAVWFLSQMLRWGELENVEAIDKIAQAVYRPDVFRIAARAVGQSYPEIDTKTEGRHGAVWTQTVPDGELTMGADCFMDGRLFDPQAVADYVAGFELKRWPASVTGAAAESPAHGDNIIEQAL
jgi:nitrate/nitrite transport system substrate-binding protein